MQFVKVNLGDLVFDAKQEVKGKVIFIDFANKTAKVEVIIERNESEKTRKTKLVDCKLHNLVVIERVKKKKFDKNRQFTLVKEFHTAFNHPIATTPTPLGVERALNRTIWTGEELVEFLHASSKSEGEFSKLYDSFLKGLQKAYQKSLKSEYITDDTDRIVAQSDALIDSLYFLNGSFVEIGVKPQPLFEIVQNSNMSKLFTENGKKVAKYREDGKILKSPEFFPPEEKLKEEVKRQINLSLSKK